MNVNGNVCYMFFSVSVVNVNGNVCYMLPSCFQFGVTFDDSIHACFSSPSFYSRWRLKASSD